MDTKTWQPTSPDMNPTDYCVWGYMRREAEELKPESAELSLEIAIRAALHALLLNMIQADVDSLCKRCAICSQAEGAQFKHMLQQEDLPLPPPREGKLGEPCAIPYDLDACDLHEPLHQQDNEAEYLGAGDEAGEGNAGLDTDDE